MKFKIGDRVVITGDEADVEHEQEPGTTGIIIECNLGVDYEYPRNEVYRVATDDSPDDPITMRNVLDGLTYRDNNIWDVHEIDLELEEIAPVTDEELQEVHRSFGVT